MLNWLMSSIKRLIEFPSLTTLADFPTAPARLEPAKVDGLGSWHAPW